MFLQGSNRWPSAQPTVSRKRIYGVTISPRYFPANRRAGHYLTHAVTVWARVGGSGDGGVAGADHRCL